MAYIDTSKVTIPKGFFEDLNVPKLLEWLNNQPAADVVPREEVDKLEYTLLGVMHSVDKWLDGGELEQNEVNRAITMRENTLRIVENLQAEVERLNGELIVESTRRKNAVIAYHSAKQEVAREIFKEIEKIIEKHHSECYEYEDGDECDTAITYISYLSVDIAELKEKYLEGFK